MRLLAAASLAWLGAASLGCPAAAQSSETCVDVRVGDQRSYACVNAALAEAAKRSHAAVVTGALSPSSPPQQIGAFDRTATAQRMGDAFGHSVVSQRPPPPVFISPLFTGPR